jgi:hypothetical protein
MEIPWGLNFEHHEQDSYSRNTTTSNSNNFDALTILVLIKIMCYNSSYEVKPHLL